MNKMFRPSCVIHLLFGVAMFLFDAQAQVRATGFASVSGNGIQTTTGGYGGKSVTVDNQGDLAKAAGSSEPMVISVKGSIKITPFGHEISVKSNKTIQGIGSKSEIVQGGFNLSGVSNVIFRNLTIRDSYLEGDWDGKKNDFDGFQMDNSHHIWIDHCHLTRGGDGLIDSRKGTTFLTVSWCKLSNHNKAFGIGWTDDVNTQITIHHTWFYNTHQRNPSADNILRCHLYNNLMEDIHIYGNWARGGTNMVIENSVYRNVKEPHFLKNPGIPTSKTGTLQVSGSLYYNCTGQRVQGGTPFFNPKDFYEYTLHKTEDVENLLKSCAGPQEDFNCEGLVSTIATSKDLVIPTDGPAIYNEGNLCLVINFPDLLPLAVSVYSLDGKLQHEARNISSSHRWRASGAGIYYLLFKFEDGRVNSRKVVLHP